VVVVVLALVLAVVTGACSAGPGVVPAPVDAEGDVVDLRGLPAWTDPAAVDPTLAGRIREYGSSRPAAYAGLVRAGTHLYAGFTVEAEGHLERLRAGLGGDGDLVRAFRAEHTYAGLETVHHRLAADRAGWQARGVRISATGIDERRNRVTVFLVEDRRAWRDAIVREYGPVVRVEVPGFRALG
jgi:hypothetical protein